MFNLKNIDRNSIYGVLVFLVCYVLIVLIALKPPFAFDSYWHLQMGKDLLENGLSPWVDHYSFTHYGKEIAPVPFIFQILLATFVSIFDETNGFFFFKVFYVTLLMGFIYIYFRQIKAHWFVVFLILPFITYFISLRLIIRPEVISYVLMVVALSLYIEARKNFATKELLSISLLLLFWVNYHSPIFGYIIIFALFLDKFIHKLVYKDNSFSWRYWAFWGGVMFVIGFIKPSGDHIFIATLALLGSEFGKYTMEYAPSMSIYSMDKIVYLSWILSIYTMIMSLMKKQYGLAFIAVFLVYFSWSTLRLVSPVAIINFCILAYLLSQISYSKVVIKLKPLMRNIIIVFSVCLSFMGLYTLVRSAQSVIENRADEVKILDSRYPVQIVDYLKTYHSGGNILNYMGSGGFLINKLSPNFKIFIDGRTNILYPIEFFKSNNDVEFPKYDKNIKIQTEQLNTVLNTYDVQYAIYKNSPEKLIQFNGTDKLHLNFADENFLLYSKNKEISFPVSSQLLVLPMCWNEGYLSSIKNEISLSKRLIADKTYTLKEILLFLDNYQEQVDKSLFLRDLDVASLSFDSIKRLAAYMAIKHFDYESALKFFASIKVQNDYDLIMMAYSLIENKNYTMAENILFHFYSKNKFPNEITVSFEKIAIFSHLLREIQKEIKLTKFLSSYMDGLDGKLKKANYNNGMPLNSIIPYQYACHSYAN